MSPPGTSQAAHGCSPASSPSDTRWVIEEVSHVRRERPFSAMPTYRACPRECFICDRRPGAPFWAVSKHILTYGLIGGATIALLKLIEYQYLVVEHSVEIYGALIAALFAAFGIWLGLHLTRAR